MLNSLVKMYYNGPWAKRSFMEDLCMSLDSKLTMRTGCIIWFEQATIHCTKILTTFEPTKATLLEKVGKFFQTDTSDPLFNNADNIRMNPELMTADECKALYVGAVEDYIAQAPFYTAQIQLGEQFWFNVNLLMWIITMAVLVFGCFFVYRCFGGKQGKREQIVRDGRAVCEVGAKRNGDTKTVTVAVEVNNGGANHGGANQHTQKKSERVVTHIKIEPESRDDRHRTVRPVASE